MDFQSILTVFVFMSVLLAGAAYGGGVIARWEAKQTKEEIHSKMTEIRKQILGKP